MTQVRAAALMALVFGVAQVGGVVGLTGRGLGRDMTFVMIRDSRLRMIGAMRASAIRRKSMRRTAQTGHKNQQNDKHC